ncbi:unnamed protein product, partial [Meganyctiphanes norvegica]
SVSCLRRLDRTSSRHTLTRASSQHSTFRSRHSKYCDCSSGASLEANMVQAKVVFASSQDPAYPPDAMLDGRPDTFWVTCGLYPQQFVVSLPSLSAIDTVALTSYNVRELCDLNILKINKSTFEKLTMTD